MSIMQKLTITTAGAALLTLSTVAPAAAVSLYSIQDLGNFQPLDFNDAGQVLGASGGQTFLYENGNKTDLSAIGAKGINNLGQAIGFSGGQLLLREKDGTINNLGSFSCPSSECQYADVSDINDQGQVLARIPNTYDPVYFRYVDSLVLRDKNGTVTPIPGSEEFAGYRPVGSAFNNKGQVVYYKAYRYLFASLNLWDNGTTTNLSYGQNQSSMTTSVDINDLGQVVTARLNSGRDHAFLWKNPLANPVGTDLGTLGGDYSGAYAINNLGQVVGSSETASGQFHGFLWESGTMFDLNSLIPADSGWKPSNPVKINNKGQIVGTGYFNGQERTFLLTPESKSVPEPTSVLGVLAFTGFGVGCWLLRKRKYASGIKSNARC